MAESLYITNNQGEPKPRPRHQAQKQGRSRLQPRGHPKPRVRLSMSSGKGQGGAGAAKAAPGIHPFVFFYYFSRANFPVPWGRTRLSKCRVIQSAGQTKSTKSTKPKATKPPAFEPSVLPYFILFIVHFKKVNNSKSPVFMRVYALPILFRKIRSRPPSFSAFIGCTLFCCICSVFLSVSFRRRKPYLSYLLPARLAFRQIQNPGMKKNLCYIIKCAYSKGLHFYRHYSVVL